MLSCLAIGVCIAAPLADTKSDEGITIVQYEHQNLPDGGYSFLYELSDGQFKQEYGRFEKIGDELVLVVTGSYSYIGTDGKTYQVKYKSDHNGFRASGGHLPDTNTDVDPAPPASLPPNVIATLLG